LLADALKESTFEDDEALYDRAQKVKSMLEENILMDESIQS